jgi:hypothetical protein
MIAHLRDRDCDVYRDRWEGLRLPPPLRLSLRLLLSADEESITMLVNVNWKRTAAKLTSI